jgi:sugar phosphate isomerase/epimerase
MKKPVLGMQLFTMRNVCKNVSELDRCLAKLKKIGYGSVQVSAIPEIISPKEIAKCAENNGMDIASTHMAWPRFLTELDAVIEEHKLYNCKHPAIGGLFDQTYRGMEGIKIFLEELAPVAERLRKEGMDFSYHNHNHEFVRFQGKTWLEHLYDMASPDDLKAEIDTHWVQAGGASPLKWVKKMAGRMPILHLKEMRVALDRSFYYDWIGNGNIDWPEIMEAATQGGVEYAMYEQDDCYHDNPFELAEKTYKYLSNLGYK